MSDLLTGLRNGLATVVRGIVAVPAACLPRHYWLRLDTRIPVIRAALPSALAMVAVAAVIGIPSFFRFAETGADTGVERLLEATGWRAAPSGPQASAEDIAMMSYGSSFLALPSFLFFTQAGLVTLYLAGTGLFRAISVVVDDARGDPVLTVIDAAVRRIWNRRSERHTRRVREDLEGSEVPDILVHGTSVGFPDADFVVIASRRKPLWDAGAVIVTSDKWFRLGTPTEREMPGGLRTLYPLTEHQDLEIPRRGVTYELPRLSGAPKPK